MDTSNSDHDAAWAEAYTAGGLRKYKTLARRTGLVESYLAQRICAGGCFDPGGTVSIRVNRFPRRVTLKAEVVDRWLAAPSVKRRVLSGVDWQRVIECVEGAGFWQLPSSHRASSCGFHGETWTIEGYRDGRFHIVRRTTWNLLDGVGAELFGLGESLASLAGVAPFTDVVK